jgi:hypothetical protein
VPRATAAAAAMASLLVPLLLLLLALPPALPAATLLYVSPSGADTNPGTLALPFRTPARGILALAALCPASRPCTANATLLLRAGEYPLAAPLTLAHLAAAPPHLLTLAAYPGERATLLGALPLALAPPDRSDPLLARMPPAAAAAVLAGPVPPAAVAAGGELLLAGRPQVPARYPDDAVALAHALADASLPAAHAAACAPPPGEPFLCAGWARTNPAWNWSWGSIGAAAGSPLLAWRPGFQLRGAFTYDWSDEASTVSALHANGTVEFLQATWAAAGYWGGTRYFAAGAPEALSAPGEYYIEPATSTLYYYPPPAPLPPRALAFSATPTLLAVLHCSRVLIAGLAFSGSTSSTLTVLNSSDVTVTGNALGGSAYAGIDAHGDPATPNTSARVSIARNLILSPGWCGAWLSGGNASALLPSLSSLSHNVVLNFGRRGLVFNPALSTDGVGAAQAHNLAATGPACGAMFSGALQTLEYNVIADALRGAFDMGVVCTGPRDWTAAGVALRHNALLLNAHTPLLGNAVSDPLRVGFYLDYGNAEHSFEGNLVLQPLHPDTPQPSAVPRSQAARTWGIYNHGGRSSAMANNAFLGLGGAEANAGGVDGGDAAQLTNGSHYFASLAACGGSAGGWRAPPCATALPPSIAALAGAAPPSVAACLASPATCGAAPFNNSLALTLALLPGGANLSASDARCPLALRDSFIGRQWWGDNALGFAAGSAGAAAAALDFALAPGAPALAAGFQQLRQAQWGPDWLGSAGAWRRVLFTAAPWAVGSGPGGGNASSSSSSSDGSGETPLAALLEELTLRALQVGWALVAQASEG